jgi:hypothetical protein
MRRFCSIRPGPTPSVSPNFPSSSLRADLRVSPHSCNILRANTDRHCDLGDAFFVGVRTAGFVSSALAIRTTHVKSEARDRDRTSQAVVRNAADYAGYVLVRRIGETCFLTALVGWFVSVRGVGVSVDFWVVQANLVVGLRWGLCLGCLRLVSERCWGRGGEWRGFRWQNFEG